MPAERPETVDELFAAIAARSPSFAGMFIRDGQLIVKATVPSESVSVLGAIRATGVVQRAPVLNALVTEGRVRYEEAAYGFNDLREIRDALQSSGRLRRAAFTDLDEVENRVRVGFRDSGAADELQHVLGSLSIPAAAVVIEHRWGEPAARLGDRFRPGCKSNEVLTPRAAASA